MIVADVSLDDSGIIRSCSIEGHAGAGPFGGDIVCAAVSVLARTALKALSEAEGVAVSAAASRSGGLGCGGGRAPP